MDPSTTLETVRNWPRELQLDFVFRLWDEIIAAGVSPEPTDDLVNELEKRLVNYERDPGNVRTWEQVVARVKAK